VLIVDLEDGFLQAAEARRVLARARQAGLL